MSKRTKEIIRLSVEVEIEYEEGFRDAAVRYALDGIYLYGCTNHPADIIARTTGNREEIEDSSCSTQDGDSKGGKA